MNLRHRIMALGITGLASLTGVSCSDNFREFLEDSNKPAQVIGSNDSYAVSNGAKVKYGDKATIPEWTWVDQLKRTILGGTQNLDETCGVEAGGTITVQKVDQNGNALVLYEAPTHHTAGTPCETGTLFRIGVDDFVGLTSAYEDIVEFRKLIRSEIESVFSDNYNRKELNYEGKTIRVGDIKNHGVLGWVNVMNLEPAGQMGVNTNRSLSFQDVDNFDMCIVKDGESRVLGFTSNDFILLEYEPTNISMGTPCPPGLQYVLSPEKFLKSEK